MADLNVLCLGRIFLDVILTGLPHMPHLDEEVYGRGYDLDAGGGVAITAVGLARLGLRVGVIAQTGDDPFGRWVSDRLRSDGVDTGLLRRDPRLRTNLTIALSFPENRALATYRDPNDEIAAEAIADETLRRARHLHIKSYPSAALSLLARARRLGLSTSWDLSLNLANPADAMIIEDVLKHTDVFLPSQTEVVSGGNPREMLDKLAQGGRIGVIKRGAAGAIGRCGEVIVEQPAFSVPVLDTTGAGDAYNAGFVYGYLQGWSLADSMTLGAVCGALSVTQRGGTAGLPPADGASRFLQSRGLSGHPLVKGQSQ